MSEASTTLVGFLKSKKSERETEEVACSLAATQTSATRRETSLCPGDKADDFTTQAFGARL